MAMRKPAKDDRDDPAMQRVRELWTQKQQDDGWTQQQLGERMGYPADSARQSVSQFFKTHDPKASTLRRFARAIGISTAELFIEDARQ